MIHNKTVNKTLPGVHFKNNAIKLDINGLYYYFIAVYQYCMNTHNVPLCEFMGHFVHMY